MRRKKKKTLSLRRVTYRRLSIRSMFLPRTTGWYILSRCSHKSAASRLRYSTSCDTNNSSFVFLSFFPTPITVHTCIFRRVCVFLMCTVKYPAGSRFSMTFVVQTNVNQSVKKLYKRKFAGKNTDVLVH
jgi:hypothetical protein